MTEETPFRVRITERVYSHLTGTGAFQTVRHNSDAEGEHPDDLSLMRKVIAAPVTRKDRRFDVHLTADELAALRLYVENLRDIGGDNTWDADGRADLAAARAALTQIDRERNAR